MFEIIVIGSLLVLGILIIRQLQKTIKEQNNYVNSALTNLGKLEQQLLDSSKAKEESEKLIESLQKELELSRLQNSSILSQKKSSETNLGGIGENFAPFLEGFKYDPKSAHFLGAPLDFIIYDINSADPAIIFLEVKTGKSKLSNKQKLIKNLIKTGKVRFEEYRIGTKGTKSKTTLNEDEDE
jgi:predicted Holliday junction resolvase-like endonuclease